MIAPESLFAASAPVIPNFGRQSTCVTHNGVFCWSWFDSNWHRIFLHALLQHIVLCAIAVGVGLPIAAGAALLTYRKPILERPLTALGTLLYTIPSLAFLQILVPITGLTRLSAEIVLISYTLLVLYRNTVTGLRGASEATVDAATGIGLTERQILLRVRLPLAVPAIVAGLRVSTVLTISLATIAAFIINQGLGAPIFDAIQHGSFKTELIGAGVLAIALALLADLLLLGLQRVVAPWQARGGV